MSRWALINNGIVDTVVDQSSQPQIPGLWVEGNESVGPGDLYDGTVFTRPVAGGQRHITQLAFLNRFTDAEAVAVDLASIGATSGAASLRRYQNKVSAARYINLDLTETRGGVEALETAGLLAVGRAAVILDAPVLDSERP